MRLNLGRRFWRPLGAGFLAVVALVVLARGLGAGDAVRHAWKRLHPPPHLDVVYLSTPQATVEQMLNWPMSVRETLSMTSAVATAVS